jgi:hypothetical protein
MSCKCGATTHQGHIRRVEEGYPGHVYTGHHWGPTDG